MFRKPLQMSAGSRANGTVAGGSAVSCLVGGHAAVTAHCSASFRAAVERRPTAASLLSSSHRESCTRTPPRTRSLLSVHACTVPRLHFPRPRAL
ncbi:hypothetical protein LSCM1_08290 [Leishmania martiniquensis]|uniref:Uncharacterized protein n=1 Tax=Leishmania martiniquensis TaxID=1580590 RepID=A0A836KJS4_9TRYP|nr:hypothetical protein LSCM1_03612 [Leishmania martiniquensis]KAG5487974.1 hypothetical protein LSCM1_08290 [Leishmania martiniquensis]